MLMSLKQNNLIFEILNYIYLFLKLLRMKPNHIIIGGYGYLQNWIALFYAVIFNKKEQFGQVLVKHHL